MTGVTSPGGYELPALAVPLRRRGGPDAAGRLLFLTLELENDSTGESGVPCDIRTVIAAEAAFQSSEQGFYE